VNSSVNCMLFSLISLRPLTLDRSALWEVLLKIGCRPDFVNIRSFHEGMRAAVIENGEISSDFDVTNGTKQCVFWPRSYSQFCLP